MNDKPTYQELENQIAELKKQNGILHLESSFKNEEKTKRADELVIANKEQSIAEQVLKESLESFFENNKAIMLQVHTETKKIINANESAVDFYGYSKNELLQKSISSLNTLLPDEIDKLMKKAVKNKSNFFQFQHKLANGKIKDVEIFSSLMKFNNELSLIVTVYDITERKQSEEALKESRYLYKETQKIAKMGGWSYDVESQQMTFTDTIYEIYGKRLSTAEEGIQFYHPDDKEIVWNSFSDAISKQKPYDLEVRFINAQGDNLFVRTIGQPIIENGKVIKIYGNLVDITERKQAEEELIKTKEAAERYLDVSGSAFLSLDINGDILLVNQKCLEILEYDTSEELIGKNWFDSCLPSEIIEQVKQVFNKVIKSNIEGVEHFENDVVTKSGKHKSIYWINSYIKNEKGQIIYLLSSGIDITERKQAEEQIKAKSLFLESLIQQSPLPTFVLDSKGLNVMVNEAFLKFYAVPDKGMLLGRNALTDPANLSQGVVKYFKEALSGKVVEMPEVEFVAPYNNKKAITRCKLFPIFDPAGKLTNVVVMQEDITEYNQAEKELIKAKEKAIENEARINTIIQTIPDLIWLKDIYGTYLKCNKRFEDFFGATESKIIGKTDYDFVDKETADFFRAHDKKAMEAGKPTMNTEQVIFANDGHKEFLETIKTPLTINNKIVGVLGIGRNITERKLAEQELTKHREHLEDLVKERTKELEEKNKDLEHYNELFVGREFRIKELREEIKELKKKVEN